VLLVGENPFRAAGILFEGAFGSGQNIAFTLFYATNFIFTGLAVAVAFHCGLFNIGGEGQAYIAGLGVSLVALTFDAVLPWWLTFPLAIMGAAAMGALWALIPAYLQARRGSHIVITTIMFNFIAASIMVYVLVDVLKPLGEMAPQTRTFLEGAQLPKLGFIFEAMGLAVRSAPLNVSFLLALVMAYLVWLLIWRTKLGYEMRTMGHSPKAARYAGIGEAKIVIVTMMISGALAGLMALNPIMGDQHHMALDFVAGAGFVGIAVALMGRSHPAGIVPAAILFGMLYQGGAELAFEMPNISRDMIVIIQGLVILFAGALEHMFRAPIQTLFASFSPRTVGLAVAKGEGA
jgi:general nucleoside transport system permease protein